MREKLSEKFCVVREFYLRLQDFMFHCLNEFKFDDGFKNFKLSVTFSHLIPPQKELRFSVFPLGKKLNVVWKETKLCFIGVVFAFYGNNFVRKFFV